MESMVLNNTTELVHLVPCDEVTETDLQMYRTISWLFENVLQTVVGISGLLANSLAVPILCSREMNSIFNRLLVLLAVFDNFYILCSVLEAMRKRNEQNELHEYAFGYGLYQLHNFVLCGSIYVTVALAMERYRAVWRPVEYHNQCKGVNPWRRVATSYLLPVVIFSAVFNIPKFLEVELVVKGALESMTVTVFNETTNQTEEIERLVEVNRTMASPTTLRLDYTYVVLYVNSARLLVQGVIPFLCLSVLNYRIYWVMKRRRQLINRPSNTIRNNGCASGNSSNGTTTSQQRKANEAQQAVVLFIIVLLFFLCHTPRFVLNVHEFLTLDALRRSIENGCNDVSVWALSGASVSHFLMTLNSSVNFFIYAFTSCTFRGVLKKCVLSFLPKSWRSRGSVTSDDEEDDRVETIMQSLGDVENGKRAKKVLRFNPPAEVSSREKEKQTNGSFVVIDKNENEGLNGSSNEQSTQNPLIVEMDLHTDPEGQAIASGQAEENEAAAATDNRMNGSAHIEPTEEVVEKNNESGSGGGLLETAL